MIRVDKGAVVTRVIGADEPMLLCTTPDHKGMPQYALVSYCVYPDYPPVRLCTWCFCDRVAEELNVSITLHDC